jgi:Arc/MetJ-type ribon-helix-helix transcriptional regulator
MAKITVLIAKDRYGELKERARINGISFSAAIREAIDLWLERYDRASAARRSMESIGKFRSGRKDISEKHDVELAEIYMRRRPRNRKSPRTPGRR